MENTNLTITGRKLFMVEHPELGIWYFTKPSYAARAIGTTYGYMHGKLKNGHCKIKGFNVEEIEDNGDIISMYIDQPVLLTKNGVIRY